MTSSNLASELMEVEATALLEAAPLDDPRLVCLDRLNAESLRSISSVSKCSKVALACVH